MSKGLKKQVEEAMATSTEEAKAALPPIQISPGARQVMTKKVREWTGWPNATLVFGPPPHKISPIAVCDHEKRALTVDPEYTLLNPNRVLLTVTPFRLRQEAVLTGALLHEAGHARHTHWKPRTVEEIKTKPLLHSDGTTPTKQAISLAKLMEEPRVEALIAAEADDIGALGLGWTMRAMAAHLLPPTELSADPSQALMDIITSWALRAGRQAALNQRMRGTKTPYRLPGWVTQFTALLHETIEAHLSEREEMGADLIDSEGQRRTANYLSLQIQAALLAMATCDDDTGPTMIDLARDVLKMLFPETPGDDDSDAGDGQAMAGGSCGDGGEAAEDGESGDESAEEDSEGEEGTDEADSPGDGGSEAEEDDSGASDSTEGGDDDESESTEDESDPSGGDGGETEQEIDTKSIMAKALAAMEADAKEQVDTESETKSEEQPPMQEGSGGSAGGKGAGGSMGGGWRTPSGEERQVQKGAERFLRDMIDASETSKRSLTDQPSASVDGGALAAWKAGGQIREPHFFVRTRRNVEPSPPIKIAILVDVSASMDELQKPSALLSWALASAALDLRNFAGRGQQIESCLIHWGDSTKIIQRPGQVLPGIREVACNQGTSNMHGALTQIEEAIPGFYDMSDRPVNRLIVQFTDWKVFEVGETTTAVGRALEAGVNMLSVVPGNYSHRWTPLNDILRGCKIQRGATSLVKYNPGDPGAVWDQAATALAGSDIPTMAASTDVAASYGF